MMIKFLAHGAGVCKRAADYLLGTRDHSGKKRAEVRPLRGDAHRTGVVADTLPFKWRYSSAVIAWAKADAPRDSEIEAMLDDFDRVAFAGMESDEYSRAAVLHVDDDGARHVHVLIARTDLATGRSYNPAPPGWQRSFDLLRDMHNYANGWARPDDPARRSAIPVEFAAAEFHSLVKRGREKEKITVFLMDDILAGRTRDRPGVIAFLKGLGKITRIGEDSILIRVKGHGQPLRLKGPIYGADFDAAMADELIADEEAARHGLLEPDSEPDPEKAEIMRDAMEAAIRRRADGFAATHRRVQRESAPEPALAPTTIRAPQPEVNDDGDRTTLARLAEEVGRVPHRAREALERTIGRFDVALERHDRAAGDHERGLRELDGSLRRLAAADRILIESVRRHAHAVGRGATIKPGQPRNPGSSGPKI